MSMFSILRRHKFWNYTKLSYKAILLHNQKSQNKNLDILRKERTFKIKWKIFFIVFNGFHWSKQNQLFRKARVRLKIILNTNLLVFDPICVWNNVNLFSMTNFKLLWRIVILAYLHLGPKKKMYNNYSKRYKCWSITSPTTLLFGLLTFWCQYIWDSNPDNIGLFKVNNKNTKNGVKYVQS